MALSTVTQDDIPAILDMQSKAFADDMLGQVLFPETPATNAWWAEGLKEAIADSKHHIMKYTEDNKIVGYAKWEIPQTLDLETVKSNYVKPVPWGSDSDHDFNNAWLRECYKHRLESLQNRPHWYLQVFCVHPDYQGRGIASKLLRNALDQADESGFEAWLEATPRGAPVYEKFGYKKVGTVYRLDGTHKTECMLRQPAKAK